MAGRVALQLILLGLCVVVLSLAATLEVAPTAVDQVTLGGWTLPELCQSKRLLRIDCPGCGLTRAFIYMAHGDVPAAFNMHPVGAMLFVGLLLAVPFLAVNAVWIYRGNRSLIGELGISMLVMLCTVGLIIQWLIRLCM